LNRADLTDWRLALRTWVPAVAWTVFTLGTSADIFSAKHTGGIVIWFFRTFLPNVDPRYWDITHTFLRKTAHFLNYGLLSWFWFRAARFWQLRERSLAWKYSWALWGIGLTALTAIAEETIETFIPSRDGSVSDVLLDTAGAICVQMIILLVWRSRRRKLSLS
jgi:VanZ family protein